MITEKTRNEIVECYSLFQITIDFIFSTCQYTYTVKQESKNK